MQPQQPSIKRQDYTSNPITQTHNIVVQNIVQNKQIKFITFHRIDHIKMLYKNKQQHRFINCLVAAGRNFVKLYAIYSQGCYEQLAQYRIYEDITAIYSWDRVIVVQTKQNIVGLAYEDTILKNAFMLSLQFLPLNPTDHCECQFDKHGLLFTVQIKNFLLICLSDSIITKYKTKPLYKQFTEIITQDIKWNRPQKTYIEEVIKIKISDFELNQISNVNICNEAFYFVGLKNFQKPNEKGEFYQKAFYHVQVPMFFTAESKTSICQFLAKKDDQVQGMIPYVYNKQMQCLFCKRDSIYVQIGREMVLVDQFQHQSYQIVHKNFTECYSIWVKTSTTLTAYYRNNNNTFYSKQYTLGIIFNQFLLKQQLSLGEGVIIYSNETELAMIKIDLTFVKRLVQQQQLQQQLQQQQQQQQNDMQEEQEIILSDKLAMVLNKSFGNVVDFQFAKNSIFIIQSKRGLNESQPEQCEIKSKCYQLRRCLVADPKPYITHEKKKYLQTMLLKHKFKSIKTLKFKLLTNKDLLQQQSHLINDNIIVTETPSTLRRFTFYRQSSSIISSQVITGDGKQTAESVGLETVLDGVFDYAKVMYQERDYLVVVDAEGMLWVEKDGVIGNQSGRNKKKKIEWKVSLDECLNSTTTQLNNKLFFVQNYLLYNTTTQQQKCTFCAIEIFTLQPYQFQLPITSIPINLFMSKKTYSFRKKDKNSLVIQITIVYKTSMEIYQFSVESKELRMVYKSENIAKGLPFLSNFTNYTVEDNTPFAKDRLRSITCPQYTLTEYHSTSKHHYIKHTGTYTYKHITYLFFITSTQIDELLVYRKYLSFQNQCGFIYKRVILPLNIIKVFKCGDDNDQRIIDEIGEGIVKIGNIIICKGEFLEHNVNQLTFFQMDAALWTIQKEKIKMIDLKPLAGSNQPLFKPNTSRKDSKDFAIGTTDPSKFSNTLQDNIQIVNNFILTPIRTLMRKQLMGIQLTGDYFILYSKTGFQVLTQKDMKPVWACNLSSQNPQRKQVIINVKAYDHFIAVSYYDYILNQNSQFKSIKFKFRIYNILSKKKILQKPKSTDQPIVHIRPISMEKILLATSSTLYIYHIKAEKTLQPIRTRNFSKRFGLSTFSYIPEVFDQKNRSHKPCYMLFANHIGGLSFFVGKWLQNDVLRQMWFEKLRCQVRNVQLFIYGQQLKALITDQDGNLIVINLKPDTPQQPAKAEKIADMNVGAKANALRIRHDQDHKIYGCFDDGTIKSISAVKLDNPQISFIDFQEQTFCKQIPLLGGFNQRVSRLLSQKYRTYKYVSRGNMVDCDLIEDFFAMTVNLKEYILEKAELKIDQLKSIIRSI